MITIENIKEKIAPNIEQIKNPEKQIITGEGVDAIIAMIQNELEIFPVIVLENDMICKIDVLAGGFMEYGQSIWVMDYIERDEDRDKTLKNLFNLSKKIIAIMRYYSRSVAEFSKIDWEEISIYQRSGGPNYWGYEIMFNENADIDLSWNP